MWTIYHKLPVALLALLLTGSANKCLAQNASKIIKWVVEKNSTLQVEGESNVNKFSCVIAQYADEDTITITNDLTKPISLRGNLEMDILSFNCHNRMITKDLRKILKAVDHPIMHIRFISLQYMPLLLEEPELIKGWIEVELAGVVKRFELGYSFTKAGRVIHLNGGRNFCFSDFKLSPPHKLAGLVKIKDEFDVNFQLILRAVS